MKKFEKIRKTPEFEKDFKKLLKKFGTLETDFQNFIETQLDLYHHLNIDNKGIFKITEHNENLIIYKAKKFRCVALKGRGAKSGIRIIYAYFRNKDLIDFIEIYYKADQENEDSNRIQQYLKSYNNKEI